MTVKSLILQISVVPAKLFRFIVNVFHSSSKTVLRTFSLFVVNILAKTDITGDDLSGIIIHHSTPKI